MREWMIRHPAVPGLVLATLLAWSAYELYQVGMAMGGARAIAAEADRIASEALGG